MQWKSTLAGALFLPTIAVAQPIQGLYIGAGAGANFAGTLSSANQTTKINTNPGPMGVISLGWGFGNGLRAEIEGSYRSNGVSGISTRRANGQLLPLGNVSGNARTYAVMVNALYDIPLGRRCSPMSAPAWVTVGSISATSAVPGSHWCPRSRSPAPRF